MEFLLIFFIASALLHAYNIVKTLMDEAGRQQAERERKERHARVKELVNEVRQYQGKE